MALFQWLAELVLHYFESVGDSRSCLTRHDDVVDVATFRGFEGVCELLLIAGFLRIAVFASEYDFYCSFSTHYCDFGSRPRIVEITLKMLGGHNVVGASVSFSRNKGDFWNSCLSISVQKFCSVFDDTAELLGSSWQKAWYVREG